MYYEEDYEEQGGRAGDDHSATTKQQDLQGPASRRSSSSTLSEPDSSSFVLNGLGTGRWQMDWPDGTLSCLTLRGSAAWGPRSGHVERRSRGIMRTLARFGLHVMPLMILAGGVHCWWRALVACHCAGGDRPGLGDSDRVACRRPRSPGQAATHAPERGFPSCPSPKVGSDSEATSTYRSLASS